MSLGSFMEPRPRIADDVLLKMSSVGDYSTIASGSVVLNSTVREHCDIDCRNLLQTATVGDMTYTGADTSIMWAEIGRYCCISRMVDIGGNEHDYRAAAMTPNYRVKTHLAGKPSKHPDESIIAIGNDVWIGQGVSIVRKPEMEIGDGAVIGTGAVVTHSIPPYAIAVGIPARVVKYRFSKEITERLHQLAWWDWPNSKILEAWPLLSRELDLDTLAQLEKLAYEDAG